MRNTTEAMDRPQTRTPSPDRRSALRWVLVAPACLLGGALLAGIGPNHGPIVGLVAVLSALAEAGPLVLAYALASAGFGLAIARVVRMSESGSSTDTESRWLSLALGLGIMLTLSHLGGCALGWQGAMGAIATYGPIGAGILAFVVVLSRGAYKRRNESRPPRTLPRVRVSTLCSCVGVAVLIVASCSTPGVLWGSEFGGFDALSYHLQLPREWWAQGRIMPLEHNVYSFLPSYVEAAYTHLGSLAGGLLAGSGMTLVSCQLMHASMTILAAGLIGRLCHSLATMAGLDERARSAARMTGWAATLVTPWTIVTGSLAYNEMGMIAFGAAAMLVAMRQQVPIGRRAALCAFFVGMACCCKPTAIFMIAPVVGLILLSRAAPGSWWRIAIIGTAVGLVTLSPWLIRNWLHGGNPVFPQLTDVFGTAHWSAEQVARYSAAHHTDLPLLTRASLLFWPETGDPARPEALVQRGLLHDQFFAFLPLVALSLGGTLFSRWRRRLLKPTALMAIGGCLQLGAWITMTHLQSRFLMPTLLTGIPLIGLAMAMAVSEHTLQSELPSATQAPGARTDRRSIRLRRRALMGLINAGLLVQAAWLVMLFAQQGRGNPNAYLLLTPSERTGEAFRSEYNHTSPAARRSIDAGLPPEAYTRLTLGPDAGVLYLLGDSTPLYFRVPLLYHTTYDASPLGALMRSHPDDPLAWESGLRRAGVSYVLLNLSELERLHDRSGWYDPAVSPGLAKNFLDAHAELIRVWPEQGRGLYRLHNPAPGAGDDS